MPGLPEHDLRPSPTAGPDRHRSKDALQINSFAELVEVIRPAEHGCDFKLFSQEEIKNTGDCPEGIEIFSLVAHSVECVPELTGKREALETTQNAYKQMLEAIMDLRLKD